MVSYYCARDLYLKNLVFESVEGLWDRSLQTWRRKDARTEDNTENPFESSQSESWSGAESADVDVDESFLSSQEGTVILENMEMKRELGGREFEMEAGCAETI